MDLGFGIRKALARLTGAALVDEAVVKEVVKDLQRVLISNDVNVKLVLELTKRIERRCLDEKPAAGFSAREHVVKIVYDELVQFLGERYEPKVERQRILLLGLFGAGKTTSISKLAKFYQSKGLKVGVIAGDVHRPAAFDQLEQLSKVVGASFYGVRGETDARKLARDGRAALEAKNDVVIFDSAGRSAFDDALVAELRGVDEAFQPDQRFLVVSADVGQVAGRQAQQFHQAVPVTGVIVTKMDGSGKGGGALSSVHATGSKVAFLGTGEKPDAMEVFDAKRFVARLCGFADLEALMEKSKALSQEQDLQKALESGRLDYDTFLAQMKAMKQMGPLKGVMQMLGAYDLPDELLGQSEDRLKRFESAVHSMTPAERKDPDLLNAKSRQERVAKGSGQKFDQVRELVASFDQAQKMMKGMKRNRGLMKRLGGMMKNPAGVRMPSAP
jgi:signal recognition particle subunit SRP54